MSYKINEESYKHLLLTFHLIQVASFLSNQLCLVQIVYRPWLVRRVVLGEVCSYLGIAVDCLLMSAPH